MIGTQGFPVEIVFEILRKGCEIDFEMEDLTEISEHYPRRKAFAALVRSVCWRWRQMADYAEMSHGDSFWIARTGVTLFSAEKYSLIREIVKFKKCLDAGIGRNCDIIVRFLDFSLEDYADKCLEDLPPMARAQLQLFARAIDLIIPYIYSIISIKLVSSQPQVFKHLLDLLLRLKATPRLENLHLRHSYPSQSGVSLESLVAIPPLAPSLLGSAFQRTQAGLSSVHCLTVSRPAWSQYLTFPPNVTHLTLWDTWRGNHESNPLLVFLLESAYHLNLISLRIRADPGSGTAELSNQRTSSNHPLKVKLPFLTKLVIHMEPGMQSDTLVQLMELPRLERFEILYRGGKDAKPPSDLNPMSISTHHHKFSSLVTLLISFPFSSHFPQRLFHILELFSHAQIENLNIFSYHLHSESSMEVDTLHQFEKHLSWIRPHHLLLDTTNSYEAIRVCIESLDLTVLESLHINFVGMHLKGAQHSLLTTEITTPALVRVTLTGFTIFEASSFLKAITAGSLETVSMTSTFKETVNRKSTKLDLQELVEEKRPNIFNSVKHLFYEVSSEDLPQIGRIWMLTPKACFLSLQIHHTGGLGSCNLAHDVFESLCPKGNPTSLPKLKGIEVSFYQNEIQSDLKQVITEVLENRAKAGATRLILKNLNEVPSQIDVSRKISFYAAPAKQVDSNTRLL